MHANRYVERDGKVYEITARDPEQIRPIRTDNAKSLAAELNQAESWGREATKRALRQLIGVR